MNEQRYFTAPPSVYHALFDTSTVLLDTQNDLFLGLNSSSTAMWKLLVQERKSVQEASTFLAQRYRMSLEVLSKDLDAFVSSMLEHHLLHEGKHEPSSSPPFVSRLAHRWLDRLALPRPFEWIEAIITLRNIHSLLTCAGLFQTAQYIASIPAWQQVTANHQMVGRLSGVITSIAQWQPFRAACLHQSFALALMLRRRHLLAEVVIGVYTHPLSAHAWVESEKHLLQWEAGLRYPDENFLKSLTIVFRSSEVQ